jgi:hypothetical protein
VFDDCAERDSEATAHNNSPCGLGYANHVKIWDGKNIYLFGHLARVLARPGPIHRDEVLGVMGCSGAAGHRHVHFSVTRPAPDDDVEKILATPGWWGHVPVRYRLNARKATTNEAIVERPDTLSCVEEQVRATVLMR